MLINLPSDPNQPANIVWKYDPQLADKAHRPEDKKHRPMVYCGRVIFINTSHAHASISGVAVDIFRNRDLANINAKDRDAFKLIWHTNTSFYDEIEVDQPEPSGCNIALIDMDGPLASRIADRGHQVAAFAMSGISFDLKRADDWHYKHLIDHSTTLVCLLQIDEKTNACLLQDLESLATPVTPIIWQVFIRKEDIMANQWQRAYLVAMLKD